MRALRRVEELLRHRRRLDVRGGEGVLPYDALRLWHNFRVSFYLLQLPAAAPWAACVQSVDFPSTEDLHTLLLELRGVSRPIFSSILLAPGKRSTAEAVVGGWRMLHTSTSLFILCKFILCLVVLCLKQIHYNDLHLHAV